jgi:hypothetical protein
VLVIAVVVFSLREMFDIYALSAAALSLNTLFVVGVGHLLLKNTRSGDSILMLLLLGLIAAGTLAATVSAILRVSRARAAERGAA